MAEYYRILSYLYRYDKKKKMDCKGFIKAEQKRNGLKITLQIDDERLLEEIRLALCFYGKEENEKGETRWKMRQLAVLESSRHHEETVLFYPAEELPERFDIRKTIWRHSLLSGCLFLWERMDRRRDPGGGAAGGITRDLVC